MRIKNMVSMEDSVKTSLGGEPKVEWRYGACHACMGSPCPIRAKVVDGKVVKVCLLYTSPSPRDRTRSRMPSSA